MARLYGYSRVSTTDQDLSMQMDALIKHGVDERDIYTEKVSGAKRDREQLNAVLDLLRDGDSLIVYRLDRLARSTRDMLEISDIINAKGADLVSIHDHIDTKSIGGRCVFTIMSAISAMERELLISRTKDGQAAARDRGVEFGRPKKLTTQLIRQIQLAYNDQVPMKDTCAALGVSKSTYYNALKMAA